MIRRGGPAPKVYLLCGIIFTLVGTVTFALAFFLAANMDEIIIHGRGDVELLPLIFWGTGGVALVIGAALLVFCWKAGQAKRRLLELGTYVTAEITDFPVDYSVMVNGWPTYRVECSYLDLKTRTMHVFRSEPLRIDPVRYVTQQTVRVYVDKESGYQDYFVDIESLLPDVRWH